MDSDSHGVWLSPGMNPCMHLHSTNQSPVLSSTAGLVETHGGGDEQGVVWCVNCLCMIESCG